MARLDLEGGFAWLARLRSFGPIAIPRSASRRAARDARPVRPRSPVAAGGAALRRRRRRRRGRGSASAGPSGRTRTRCGRICAATVQFDYDGVVVEGPPGATAYDPARRRLVRRNRRAEQAAIDRLHQLGFRYTWSHFESRQILGISPEQFPKVVHTLVNEGWRVEAEGRAFRSAGRHAARGVVGHRLVRAARRRRFRRRPVGAVPAAARGDLPRGEDVVVLDDGSVGLAARGVAAPLRGDRRVRRRPRGITIRFGRRRRRCSMRCSRRSRRSRTTRRSNACARELQTFGGIAPLDPPPSFRGTLREYQREALGWFEFLRRFGFGGCLADDMGLGKTVMVLALLDALPPQPRHGERRPSLVVVPQSLVFNWMEEAARFAPELKVLDYTGPLRDPASIRRRGPRADDVRHAAAGRGGVDGRSSSTTPSSTRRRRSRTRRPRRPRRRGCCARVTAWR